MNTPTRFQQLKFTLPTNKWICISSECINISEPDVVIDDDYDNFVLRGFCSNNRSKNHLIYNKNEDSGFYKFQIEETIEYTIQISEGVELVELANIGLCKIASNIYKLQVVNYLGKSAFELKSDYESKKIEFEIVSTKIDYKKDYISLTEKIAHCCSQLLLDYSSAASLEFTHNYQDNQKTILEQFLFIREFCSADNINYLISSIKNNPDRILQTETELKPIGSGQVSQNFYKNPFSNSKNWTSFNGSPTPEYISVSRKYDSFDTPANRFIKFAFNTFINICEEISNCFDETKVPVFYQRESTLLKKSLELALDDDLFIAVSDLTVMPINNQVLQKREGYYQILHAFSMLDIALQLNWPGKENVYKDEKNIKGEVKNTALLYEYWLFFELFNILKNLSEPIEIYENDSESFISKSNDSLLISLRQGQFSRVMFKIKNSNLHVNLYYNKTFSHRSFSHESSFGDSYSREFRPDYTLEFYKDNYDYAKQTGLITYVHFDAKYRLTDLSTWFDADDSSKLDNEKRDETLNTYKRGDLLKMHTYNDAIRRTIGSYVIYPGDNTKTNSQFQVYDELLPGVGAFALKPSNHEVGESVLTEFIESIIAFELSEGTRESRIRYFENNIINYAGENETFISKDENDLCMIGFLRSNYYKWLQENKFISNDRDNKHFYFYFHAIRNGNVISINPNIHRAKYFCGYITDPKINLDLKLENWIAEIGFSELVSKNVLISKLNEIGYEPESDSHKLNADFYYLVELKNLQLFSNTILKHDDYYKTNGNYAESMYSPFVCNIRNLNKRG